MNDEEERKEKLEELRKLYLPIIDSNIEEQTKKEMHEAAKKLKVLRTILVDNKELPTMGFLYKCETILKKLDNRKRGGANTPTNTTSKGDDKDDPDDCKVIEVKKIENRTASIESCPRSPSPVNETEAISSEPTKLIPVEKRNSLLDLPMPSSDDSSSDEDTAHSRARPVPLPQPIANLINSTFGAGTSHSNTRQENADSTEPYTPADFEEPLSPPKLDIFINSDDDDDDNDLIIDEGSPEKSVTKPPEKLLPPPPPLRPPPRPPSFLTIGMSDLASLADSAASVNQHQNPQDSPNPADDFIPGRQMSRVPSSLMASKTGTTKPMPSPRPSSTRVPPSPAYTCIDMFSVAQAPKYQFGPSNQINPSNKPISICPPQPRTGGEPNRMSFPTPAPAPSQRPISLPDFAPPPDLFAPPQRSQPQPSQTQSRDPRNRNSYPPPPAQENRSQPPPRSLSSSRDPRDPRGHERNFRKVAEVRSQQLTDKHGQAIPRTYKEHKAWKKEQERREQQRPQQQRPDKEMSFGERKRLEQEERRRREAAKRQEEHGIQERSTQHQEESTNRDLLLQQKMDMVKTRTLSKHTSRVQIIDPLPAPLSEIKKLPRRVSDERRSSTDSDSSSSSNREKNVDKSLEKVSPLNSLYGEMPQPSKGIFRIPKKPSAARSRRSPSPPPKKSPSPPPVEMDMDNDMASSPEPSVDEEVGKEARETEKNLPQKEKGDAAAPQTGLMLNEDLIKDHIRSIMQAEKKDEPKTSNLDSSLFSPEYLNQIIRSVVQEELSKRIPLPVPESSTSKTVKEPEPEVSESKQPDEAASVMETVDSTTPDKNGNNEKDAAPVDVPAPPPEEVAAASTKDYDIHQAVENEMRKQRMHKKSELDKLQDDLRDSFIKDGVMNAVGPRTRNPVSRYTDKSKVRSKEPVPEPKAAVPKEVLEEDIEMADTSDENRVTKNLFVRLERLAPPAEEKEEEEEEQEIKTFPARRAVAKRGRPIGQIGRALTPRSEDEPADSIAEDDLDLASLASEDASISGSSIDVPVRGMPSGRRGRGRSRGGGRKGRRSAFDGYQSKEEPTLVDLDYILKPNEAQPCILCSYEGKKPIDHYKSNHPEIEILISRLPKEEAAIAIQQQQKSCTSPVLQCRFCIFTSSNHTEFYDHVSEHTGEYRFKCPLCTYSRPKKDSVSFHIRTKHNGNGKTECLVIVEEQTNKKYVAGFLCGFCNFVQLDKEKVMKHIELRHRIEPGNICLSGMEECNKINMSRVERQEGATDAEVNIPVEKLLTVKKEKEENVDAMEIEEEQDNFMAMLDDLIQDQPRDSASGKSLLESIRRSKTTEGESVEVKKIEIAKITISSTPRPAREDTPEPPEEINTSFDDSIASSTPEKYQQDNRKRGQAIVGICYACGHTEGHDINNLFRHIKDVHPPEKRGNCPDCSRPLSGTAKAIKHMIEEHVPIGVREALLNFWKPEPVSRKRVSDAAAKATEPSRESGSDIVTVPMEDQPKAFQHARSVKNSAVYASMLEPGRLQKLYKCMGRNCSFCTVMPEKFIKHIDWHKSLSVARMKDWQECVYCLELYDSGHLLVEHFHNEHNKFVFQCSLCFFRGATDSCVSFHQKVAHKSGEIPKTFLCQKEQPKVDQPNYSGIIGKFILPYVCAQGDCKMTFLKTENFANHLDCDHRTLETYKCHECGISESSIEDLLKHYKDHSYNEFHCLYCKFGAAEEGSIYNHMCKHANLAPCFAVRTLLGLKTDKNPLAGALKRMEVKTTAAVYQPPMESENSDSDENAEEDEAPQPEPLPKQVFSRTLNAMGKAQAAAPTSTSTSTPFSRVQSIIEKSAVTSSPSVEEPPKPPETKVPPQPSPVYEPEPGPSKAVDTSVDSENPVAPPPVTMPLSTFSRAQGNERPYDNSEEVSGVVNLQGHRLYKCCKPGCNFTGDTSLEYSDHLSMCDCVNLFCVHCKKPFKQVSPLVDHLKLEHGPLRFNCGVCKEFKSSNLNLMKKHMRQFHNFNQVVTKALDPMKTDEDVDLFEVFPRLTNQVKPPSKSDSLRRFSPGEEKDLPPTPIFLENVVCAVCEFKTRVRSNMSRHLKDHAEKGDQVSSAAIPINPMPCLKNNEKHFDKMSNWAQSSHFTSDGAQPIPGRRSSQELSEEVKNSLPAYILEPTRFACGICQYKGLDVEMLKNHMTNLHADATDDMACIHCPTQEWQMDLQDLPLIERYLHHMTLHGPNLYVCLVCRHSDACTEVISKHTFEEHDLENHFQVIREEEQAAEGTTWCCSECSQTRYTFEDIKTHCSNMHNINFQYRCQLCNYRSARHSHILVNHFPKEHPGKPAHAMASFYPKGCSDPRITIGAPTIMASEADTSIRHIRMIRIEEVGSKEKKSSPEKKKSPNKSAEQVKLEELVEAPVPDPDGQFFVCPSCLIYKNRQKCKMEEHLFKHFNHKKYTCSKCMISVVSKTSMQTHLQKIHSINGDFSQSILVKDWPELESWVSHVLITQSAKMPLENAGPVIVDTTSLPSSSTASDVFDFSDEIITNFDEPGPSQSEPPTVYEDAPSVRKKSLQKVGNNICKHCKESFKTLMALMMHIRLYHYKCGKFICAYCNVSSNSDNVIMKHSKKKHPDEEPKALRNEKAVTTEFTAQFWNDNYGIYMQDGWKMRSTEQAQVEPMEPVHECQHCDFKTNHLPAMKRHATSHKFTYGCGVCNNFESQHSVDVRVHSEQLHPGEECLVNQILKTPRTNKRKSEDGASSGPAPKQQAVVAPTSLPLSVAEVSQSSPSTSSAEQDVPAAVSPAPGPSGVPQKNAYTCHYCKHITEDRLKKLYTHWENEHKAENLKFLYKTQKVGTGKQCSHCQMRVTSQKSMEEHFKQNHPEFVSITFTIYKCKVCQYRTDILSDVVSHIRNRHPHVASDPSYGYTTENRLVNNKKMWYCCVHCQEFDSTTEQEIIEHSDTMHADVPAKFVVLTNKTQRFVREVGRKDQAVGSLSLKAVRPHIKSEVPPATPSPPPNLRRQYLCPNCTVKTKTLKGMEEHLTQVHARLFCVDCKQPLLNDIAAKMHFLVEHREPGSGTQPQNIIRYDKDVVEFMKQVRREGDDLVATNSTSPALQFKKEEPRESEMLID